MSQGSSPSIRMPAPRRISRAIVSLPVATNGLLLGRGCSLAVANDGANRASSPGRLASERSPLHRTLIQAVWCRYQGPSHRARGPKRQTEPMRISPRSSGPGVHDLHGGLFRSSLPPRTLLGFITAALAIFAIALVSYE